MVSSLAFVSAPASARRRPIRLLAALEFRQTVVYQVPQRRVAAMCVSRKQYTKTVALQTNRVASLCVASEIDITALHKRLQREGAVPWATAAMGGSVLRLVSGDGTTCFVFGWGCVVVWCGDEEREQALTQLLQQDYIGALDVPNVDVLSWRQAVDGASKIDGDVVMLTKQGECGVLERLAVSFALSQSVKLLNFEHAIHNLIQRTRQLPAEMAEHGRVISARQSDIAAMTGVLFMHRLSLESVTSRPSFFWATENVSYLTTYSRASAYMELDERNKRHAGQLNALQDLLELLATAESMPCFFVLILCNVYMPSDLSIANVFATCLPRLQIIATQLSSNGQSLSLSQLRSH
jgi:uncharacterized Rmd1/YagE family protein